MNNKTITVILLAVSSVFAAACGPPETVDAGSAPSVGAEEPAASTIPADTSIPSDAEDLPLGGGSLPIVQLDVVVTHPDHPDVSYTISCLGDTASLIGEVTGVSEFAACDQLGNDAVRNRILNGEPLDQECNEIYGGPEEAVVTGTYDGVDGETINTKFHRSDGCGMDDWDFLMAGILPPAQGS